MNDLLTMLWGPDWFFKLLALATVSIFLQILRDILRRQRWWRACKTARKVSDGDLQSVLRLISIAKIRRQIAKGNINAFVSRNQPDRSEDNPD